MPLFDVLLLSVVVLTAYLGPMVLRRLGPGQRAYGWMIVGDLVAALIAFSSRYSEGPNPIGDSLGAIAIGAAVCLVLVPPLLRRLGRWALLGDRLRLARLSADVRELLQPGMGARAERELIDTILAVRTGREEEAVERLTERKRRLESPHARRHIDERIVMTYLYARRWDDAVRHYESSFERRFGASSPQLMVEMVRAYCEAGELEAAAELVAELEGSPLAHEPILAFLVNRSRMVFLAFVGRTGAVEAIVGPRGPLGAMPDSARLFWSGLARLNAGDRPGARNSLSEAARLSARDPRAREVAERALSRIDEPGAAGPHAIPSQVAQLADRLTTLASTTPAPRPASHGRPAPRLSGVPVAQVPVTAALIAANLGVALAVYLLHGTLGDLGALALVGANVKSATLSGEWWRLVSSTFLHVGMAHLALNMYGLWVLGRLAEQFFGSVRFFGIYMVSGVAGSVASVVAGGGATSAGASGAVFGLLGAAIAELALRRRAYPKRWSGALLGNLLFLTGANVAIGFLYPIIDQSAHLGGLVAGAVLAALLSRQARIGERLPVRAAGTVLALLSAVAIAYGAVGVATTDYEDTLRRDPRTVHEVGGLRVAVPGPWERASDYEIVDPGVALWFQLQRVPASYGIDQAIEEHLMGLSRGGIAEADVEAARRAGSTQLSLPAPWRSSELLLETGELGGLARYRLAVFARAVDDEIWLGALSYPEALGPDLAPILAEVLASAEPVATP